MNYLAHLYLAGDDPELSVGGFLADFVKGPLIGDYPENIEQGMRLHRRIDFWSDQHPAIKTIRGILPEEFGRYAGIVADVLGDHFLSCRWPDHSTESIDSFSARKLDLLHANKALLPENALFVLQRMSEGQWLTNYHNLNYSLGALSRIGQRLKRDNPLHLLAEPVTQNYQPLGAICADIFNDLAVNVAEWRGQNHQIKDRNISV